MVWTKLFKLRNFKYAMTPHKVNDFWRGAQLSGRGLAKVRKVFTMGDIPFIFQQRYMKRIHHPHSPYHRFPKEYGKKETHIVNRFAKIRMGLANSAEKELKVRQELLNKRKLKGNDKLLKQVMPQLVRPQKVTSDDNFKKQSKARISEYLKGTPKGIKSATRTEKENFKNLMLEGFVGEKNLFAKNKANSDKNKANKL